MPTQTHEPMDRSEAVALFARLSDEARLRRRRTRQVRIVATSLTAAVVLGVFAWALLSLSPLAKRSQAPASATPSDPIVSGNYVFTDIRIEPWIDPVTGQADLQMVGLTWHVAWADDRFPGVHDCKWSVLDADGIEIGTESHQMEMDTSSSGSGSHAMPMDVSGDPGGAATAQITCDPARLDTPVGYDISNERVLRTWVERGAVLGVEVGFDVGWPVQPPAYPGTNWCQVTLALPTGEEVGHGTFSLSVPAGPVSYRVSRNDFADFNAIPDPRVLDAYVSCVPYTGQGDSP